MQYVRLWREFAMLYGSYCEMHIVTASARIKNGKVNVGNNLFLIKKNFWHSPQHKDYAAWLYQYSSLISNVYVKKIGNYLIVSSNRIIPVSNRIIYMKSFYMYIETSNWNSNWCNMYTYILWFLQKKNNKIRQKKITTSRREWEAVHFTVPSFSFLHYRPLSSGSFFSAAILCNGGLVKLYLKYNKACINHWLQSLLLHVWPL